MRIADLKRDGAGGIGEIDAHAPGTVTARDCTPLLEQIRGTAPGRCLEQGDERTERTRRLRMAGRMGKENGTTNDLHASC